MAHSKSSTAKTVELPAEELAELPFEGEERGLTVPERKEIARAKKLCKPGDSLTHAVLQLASNPKSPLHHRFNWDDGEAAYRYRLAQARSLIRVIVKYESGSFVRTYVHIRSEGKGYRHHSEVVTVQQLRESYLAQLEADLVHLIAKYQDFAKTCGIANLAIATLTKLLARFQKKKAA